MLGGQRHNMQDEQGTDGHEYGGVYKSTDGGVTWARVNSLDPRPMYFSEIRVDPQDDQRVYVLGVRLWRSKDGGVTFTANGHDGRVHPDHHAMWIDPEDSRRVTLGNDGGVYVTRDRMANWDHLNTMAIGQFYHVGVGPRRDYRVYGGLQDNGSWGGPSRVRHGRGPSNTDWFRVGGGDGFRCLVDANDADLVYFESQNGGIGRRHLGSGERAGMRPRQPRGTKTPYRFNWQTPFLLSPPQQPHLLRRGEPRLPVARPGRGDAQDLTGYHVDEARKCDRARGVAAGSRSAVCRKRRRRTVGESRRRAHVDRPVRESRA